jgi:hypothetical protein
VGISKTEVGDSLDLLLGELAALGFCQPDGTFITTLADLREWLGEMAPAGEAVCLDGLATRVQRPAGWANQKVLYDAKRHAHTAQGLAISPTPGCYAAGAGCCTGSGTSSAPPRRSPALAAGRTGFPRDKTITDTPVEVYPGLSPIPEGTDWGRDADVPAAR